MFSLSTTTEPTGSTTTISTAQSTTLLQTTNIPEFQPNEETWQVWKEKLDIHFCEINCTAEHSKKAVLLKSIGASAYNLLHSLCSPSSPVSKTFYALCEILQTHYTPPTIVFRERKNFYSATKSDEETVAQWFAKFIRMILPSLERIFMSKFKSSGLKLNLKKCVFFQPKISYLGFTIDKNGLSKTNERIANVLKAPVPTNVSEVRAFAGMINYYSKFIKDFAHKMNPLYKLLQKNVSFIWSEECQKAYELLKKEVTSDQVLVHFNPDIPLILSTDASNHAIAGVLSHKFSDNSIKPIAFISRALSKTEQNYSTIEKEALAIIFSVTKLKQYLLGNHFTLKTDHKPLLAIFGENRGLPLMAAARMQRWALSLSGFNYSIEYIKGISNDADHLSRMPQNVKSQNNVENSYINFIEKENSSQLNFKNIAIETRRDPILSKLSHAIQNGTVEELTEPSFESFRNKASELTVEYDCILWGYRTVIPQKFRQQLLVELHSSHLGIVKTKALARSYIWWPKIDSDIENLIKNCIPCQELQSSPEKASLISWTPTGNVWSRIHVDFAGPIEDVYFFIVIDSLSKWVEVFTTKQITSSFVIKKMRELFCRYGLIDTLVSDNGRQFTSNEFKYFLEQNNIRQVLTAPGHPATNGQAENFVKTLKKINLCEFKRKQRYRF